jgi:hypothetical protein
MFFHKKGIYSFIKKTRCNIDFFLIFALYLFVISIPLATYNIAIHKGINRKTCLIIQIVPYDGCGSVSGRANDTFLQRYDVQYNVVTYTVLFF